jgi:hypothetical protein
MRFTLGLQLLLAALALSTGEAALAGTGWCTADEVSYAPYCESFHDNETACRMNSAHCTWYPEVPAEGVCEPRDGKVDYQFYCGAFDGNEAACTANSELCVWIGP